MFAGLAMEAIRITPHSESWFSDFRTLTKDIAIIMPMNSKIHHIGSTAVPGLDAKDIIDIQLTVPSFRDFDVSIGKRIGFQHIERITGEHCPPNIILNQDELAKYFLRSSGRPANLHVHEAGRFNQCYSLLCRDLPAKPRRLRGSLQFDQETTGPLCSGGCGVL